MLYSFGYKRRLIVCVFDSLQALLLCLLLFSVAMPVSAMYIIQDGNAPATIVLPAETEFDRYVNMTPAETNIFIKKRFPNASEKKLEELKKVLPRFRAAETKRIGDEGELAIAELQEFLMKISGSEFPVVRLKKGAVLPAGNLILLGTELAEKEGLDKELNALSPDGFIMEVKGNKLILSGQRARGTLYAVYDFLESLGCRWIMPGAFGEVVPKMKTIETSINQTKNPSHSKRYWWCTYGNGKDYPRWTLRNKGDFIRALGDSMVRQGHASGVPLAYGANQTDRGIKVKRMRPDWKRDENGKILRNEKGKPVERIMVEKEVKELPEEYYTMSGGKPNTQLGNMANPKVWDLCTEYYNYYFYKNPLEDSVSISSADGLVIDDRKECRALDSNEYDWTMGAPSATDRLWFFHRRYINNVLKEHPDRKFAVLVYSNNMTPPRLETVHPSMALIFAPLGICPLHNVRDKNCKTNRAYKEWFESWMSQKRANNAEAYYYDYFPIGYQWCNFIMSPQWQIIGKNYPWFHELGLDGHTSQGFDDWGCMGLTAWVAIRLYWDVDQDYNDLVEEYCEFRFGTKAAKAMHEYYKVFEKRMDNVPDLCSNEIWGNHLAIDGETRKKAREALKKAKPLIEGEREKEQFQTVKDFQVAMDAWCDGIDYARETGDFSAAAKKLEPAFDIAAKLDEIYSHFVNPNRIDKESKRPYTPGGWHRKYLIWDKKIKESRASLVLPRMMKVALDTENTAIEKGWQQPGVSVSELEDWDTTIVPDVKYNTQREISAFFYRTDVKIPKSFAKSKKVTIYFPSIIARGLQIWINGEAVQFDNGNYKDYIWRGPSYFWFNYDHQQEFDITGLLKPGSINTIAFRIFKSFDHAGTYDRIFLLADPKEKDIL